MTLSDSNAEAKYKYLAKLAKSFKPSQMLISELNLVDLPFMMFEDNTGTIFIAGNLQVRKRTKYIYLKHHFIREFAEDRNLVQQDDICKMHVDLNTVDIGTKNVNVKVFKRYATELDQGMPMLR